MDATSTSEPNSQQEDQPDAAQSDLKPKASQESQRDAAHKDWVPKSLFDYGIECTAGSSQIFTLVLLRQLARSGKLTDEEDSKELLKLPITNIRLLELAGKYAHLVLKFRDDDYISMEKIFQSGVKKQANFHVHYVGDELAKEECVYIIGRDYRSKQIAIVFRGSITLTDWYQDFRLVLSQIPNPVVDADQPETVGIHLGFRNYMHGPQTPIRDAFKKIMPTVPTLNNSKTSESPTDEKTIRDTFKKIIPTIPTLNNSKTDESPTDENSKEKSEDRAKTKMEIICEQLRSMKEMYPEDPIVTTGHSLGGALSLISALSIATDPCLACLPESAQGRVPVKCVAIANPKPGDRAFTNAIKHLERKHILRLCCIHNAMDVVPMMPPNVANTNTGFWHPGFRILLYKHHYELGRGESDRPIVSKVTGCLDLRKKSKWAWAKRFSKRASSSNDYMTKKRVNLHNYREYMDRLLNQRAELGMLSLDGLYEEFWPDESTSVRPETATSHS